MREDSKSYVMAERNQNRQAIRMGNRSGSHENCIRIGANETPAHALAKYLIASDLIRQGVSILTEAIFENTYKGESGRPDIFVLDDGRIIEIMETETLSNCSEKVCKYPARYQSDIEAKDASTVIREYHERIKQWGRIE